MENQEYINRDVQEDIKALYDHAKVANEEMGGVKVHLAALETNMEWVKKTVEKVDLRTWAILGGILLGIAIQIMFFIFKK